MTHRNRHLAATLACLGAVLLAACSTDNPKAGQPNTGPSTSGSAPTSTTTTPGSPTSAPTPPARPEAATGASLAAGEAFIGYYIDLMNYSSTTGDPERLLAESDKGCVGCQGIADYVRKINARNGGLQGDYKNTLLDVKEIYRGEGGRVGGSASIKSGTYQERATPGASPVPQTGRTGTMEFTLSPAEGAWVMYEMQIKE